MRRIAWLLILSALLLAACRGKKPLPEAGGSYSGDSLKACYPLRSLTFPKCSWELNDGRKSISLSGNIYLRPDSIVYFRGVLLVEVFRGIIKQDSFIVVSRLDRVCYRGSNSYLSRKLGMPVNPQMLYLLLTADCCPARYRAQGFRLTQHADRMLLKSPTCILDAQLSDNHVKSVSISGTVKGSVEYGDYRNFQPYTLPSQLSIKTTFKQEKLSFASTAQTVVFDRPQAVNMQIPGGYKTVILK